MQYLHELDTRARQHTDRKDLNYEFRKQMLVTLCRYISGLT